MLARIPVHRKTAPCPKLRTSSANVEHRPAGWLVVRAVGTLGA
jgi:hypothetical protein